VVVASDDDGSVVIAPPTTHKEVTTFRVADGSIRADSVRQV